MAVDWNLVLTIGTAGFAALIFLLSFRFATNELKVAPRNTQFQKFFNRFSSFIFAAIFTAVVTFIITIITSTLSIRWMDYICAVGDTEAIEAWKAAHPDWASDANIVEAFANDNNWRSWWDAIYAGQTPAYEPVEIRPPTLFTKEFIVSLQFPTFIPVTLIAILFFLVIYPFFEMFYLAKPGSDAPMEIQQYIETNLIDRFPPPLNVVFAILALVAMYILPTYLIYAALLNFNLTPTLFPENFFFPLLAWFSVIPLMYLAYYSSFGVVTMFHGSFRKVLSAIREKRKINFKDKQEMMDLIKFVVSILLLITIIVGFIQAFPIFFGIVPDRQVPGESGSNEFIVSLINIFMIGDKMKSDFNTFVSILPFDLLIFLLTTVGLALYGFYSKFLAKEPLNRPILVFFAAYILAAIGMLVFLNVIIKYPQVYPSHYIFKNYSTLEEQETYWYQLRAVFSITLVANKTITVIFVVYNMFFNKALTRNIEEGVLNFAIVNNRTDILKGYTKNPDEEMRGRVANAVATLVREHEVSLETIIPLLDDFSDDESRSIRDLAHESIVTVAREYDDLELLVPVFLRLMNSPDDSVRSKIGETMGKIGVEKPEKIIKVIPNLLSQDLTDEGLSVMVNTLQEIGAHHPTIVAEIVVPLISLSDDQIRVGALGIAKSILFDLKDQFEDFFPKMLEATNDPNPRIRYDAIEVLGQIAVIDPLKLETVMAKLEELKTDETEVRRRVIGALCNILSSYPDQMEGILPTLFEFTDDPEPSVREDLALGISVAGPFFAEEGTFGKIQHILFKLLEDDDELVRLNVSQALYLVSHSNPSLLTSETAFRMMLEKLIADPNPDVRTRFQEIAKMFAKTEPSFALYELFVNLMEKKELGLENRRDLFKVLGKIIAEFPPELDVNMVLEPLLKLPMKDKTVRKEAVTCLNEIAKIAPYEIPRFEKLFKDLAGDPDPGVKEVVVRSIGEWAAMFIESPEKMPSTLSYQEYFDMLTSFVSKMKGEPLREAVVQLSKIYFLDKTTHQKIYPLLVKLGTTNDTVILATIIRTLTDIVVENKYDYAAKHTYDGRVVWFKGSPFQKDVQPIISRAMGFNDKLVREELAKSLNEIVENFPEGSENLRSVLLDAMRSLNPEVKLVGIKILGKFKETPRDAHFVKLLIKATNDKRNPEVRAAAFHSLEWVVRQIAEKVKVPRSLKHTLNSIAYSSFRRKFLSVPERSVREEYAEFIVHLVRWFPEYDEAFTYIKELVLDDDPRISQYAIKGFFKALLEHPEKIPRYYSYFRAFSFAKHRITRDLLLENLRLVHDKYPEDLEYVGPAVLRLARDPDPMIRNKAYEDFDNLQKKNPNKIFLFTKLVVEMGQEKDANLRRDSIRLMVSLLKTHPEFFMEGNDIFRAFTNMARDPEDIVRRECALQLPKVIPNFTDSTVNYALQMLLRFLREDDDEVKDAVVNGFRLVGDKFPYRIKDFVDDIERINKREQHPGVSRLVSELKDRIRKKK
ncbi:MAG: sister chromatid cohesion protein PDS5 [Promethearchaeota archaeon]